MEKSNDINNSIDSTATISMIQLAKEMQDKLYDIENVLQLLEVNLSSNNDDYSIIRSVQLINKMVNSIMSNELTELISLYSGCENI